MSSLSVRGIDDELSERLKQLALEEKKVSILLLLTY